MDPVMLSVVIGPHQKLMIETQHEGGFYLTFPLAQQQEFLVVAVEYPVE